MRFTGSIFSKVRDEFTSDPQSGNVRTIEWQGSRDAIYGHFSSLRNSTEGAQARCSITQVGNTPYFSLIATFPDLQDLEPEDPEEQAIDQWTISTEVLQTDAFSLPAAVEEALIWDSANPPAPKTYRKLIEDQATDETGYASLVGPAYPFAQSLKLEIGRGATHFDDEYVVLRRTRTLGNGQASKINIKAVRKIYDGNKLGVPSNVGFALPSPPPTAEWPEDAYWGWRLRTQQSSYNGNRVEQSYEWVFAAWSLNYYTRTDEAFPF